MMPRFQRRLLALGACIGVAYGQTGPVGQPATPTNSIVRVWVHGGISSVDLLKELNAKCAGVALTDAEDKADYRLEAKYAWCCTPQGQSRGYKFTLFNKDGDAVFATKTHTLANAVKDVCRAIGRERAN